MRAKIFTILNLRHLPLISYISFLLQKIHKSNISFTFKNLSYFKHSNKTLFHIFISSIWNYYFLPYSQFSHSFIKFFLSYFDFQHSFSLHSLFISYFCILCLIFFPNFKILYSTPFILPLNCYLFRKISFQRVFIFLEIKETKENERRDLKNSVLNLNVPNIIESKSTNSLCSISFCQACVFIELKWRWGGSFLKMWNLMKKKPRFVRWKKLNYRL